MLSIVATLNCVRLVAASDKDNVLNSRHCTGGSKGARGPHPQ